MGGRLGRASSSLASGTQRRDRAALSKSCNVLCAHDKCLIIPDVEVGQGQWQADVEQEEVCWQLGKGVHQLHSQNKLILASEVLTNMLRRS